VTWFFEQFVLMPYARAYRPYDERYLFLFNSYYEGAGPRHPRNARGLLTRPGVGEVTAYRQTIDEAMVRLLEGGPSPAALGLVELGLHHEQQHQELLLMDIKHVLGTNPLRPSYLPGCPIAAAGVAEMAWIEHAGGLVETGHDPARGGFCFDNETPRHRTWVEPFAIADRLITAGEWSEFIADGGYRRSELWLSDGWAVVQATGQEAPLYWERWDGHGDGRPDGWLVYTLHGLREMDPAAPVVHISYYEADAFARWSKARLPSEAEWESVAATCAGPQSSPVSLHPQAAVAGGGVQALYGSAWQWTASAYAPYPRFTPAAGVVGEYNGKFMVGQQVLRGSCAATPPGHARLTYRNFFPPPARWPFTGVRLARDLRHG
jgi:ergothioneine biosynthesis protein EgtB